jgi:hypothetical protein
MWPCPGSTDRLTMPPESCFGRGSSAPPRAAGRAGADAAVATGSDWFEPRPGSGTAARRARSPSTRPSPGDRPRPVRRYIPAWGLTPSSVGDPPTPPPFLPRAPTPAGRGRWEEPGRRVGRRRGGTGQPGVLRVVDHGPEGEVLVAIGGAGGLAVPLQAGLLSLAPLLLHPTDRGRLEGVPAPRRGIRAERGPADLTGYFPLYDAR